MATDAPSLTAVYSDESHSARLARKSKEAPFMPIGKGEKKKKKNEWYVFWLYCVVLMCCS